MWVISILDIITIARLFTGMWKLKNGNLDTLPSLMTTKNYKHLK